MFVVETGEASMTETGSLHGSKRDTCVMKARSVSTPQSPTTRQPPARGSRTCCQPDTWPHRGSCRVADELLLKHAIERAEPPYGQLGKSTRMLSLTSLTVTRQELGGVKGSILVLNLPRPCAIATGAPSREISAFC